MKFSWKNEMNETIIVVDSNIIMARILSHWNALIDCFKLQNFNLLAFHNL
jgi:hypothetical protein